MRSTPLKTTRLEARLSAEALSVVRRAAELQGRSVSDFVVAAAHDAAIRTISDNFVIQIALDDQVRFAKALMEAAPEAPDLVRARQAHQKLIGQAGE